MRQRYCSSCHRWKIAWIGVAVPAFLLADVMGLLAR